MPTLLSFVSALRDRLSSDKRYESLFYQPLKSQLTGAADDSVPIMPQIRKKDLLLSYPYQDIRTFIRLLDEAACDPCVISVKIRYTALQGTQK